MDGIMTEATAQLSRIKHIVVLMLENRSFDHMLGWLYDPDNAPPFNQVPRGQFFEGVSGKDLTNPIPAAFGGGMARVGKCSDMTAPNPNPNKDFANIYAQLHNINPPPHPVPNTNEPPNMQGFVGSYAEAITNYNQHHSSHPSQTHPRSIMDCFTPDMVPVISGLTHAYAVCDHWFSSIPSETFPNRSFLHVGTSSGYADNNWKTGRWPWDIGLLINKTDTIFNLLERAGIAWKIYHGGALLTCFAYLLQDKLHRFATHDPETNRFFQMEQFWADAAAGSLPGYSFIEPHYIDSFRYGPQNDMHPSYLPLHVIGPSNVLHGEELIFKIYQALRQGPAWESTLFVILFDEHGGCYDHVPPPVAVSPDGIVIPPNEPGGSGFAFNRLGVRVPAVLVSPYVEQGTICHTVFDHTSIIKTVINCFGLKDGRGRPATLLAREAAATDVSEVLTLSEPRTDTAAITPRPTPPWNPSLDRPLSDLHKDLLGAAARRLAHWRSELLDLSQIHTIAHATEALEDREATLRSKR
jgi:phospholipase C